MRTSSVWDASLEAAHTQRMKEIVAEIGWPFILKRGREAAHQAWLLVQHADHDPDFRRPCLALMKAQSVEEVYARNITYLENRVRVGEGRPQLYGTQFHTTEHGELEPFPIEDQEQVDPRRAEVSLETLAAYAARLRAYRASL